MTERKLIFYSDGRHTHVYAYDPPMSIQDAVAPVDEVAGSGVDTFVYGFGAGPTMYHNTRVGETWASHLIRAGKTTFQEPEAWNTLPFWRAYSNIKSLRERGLDILELLIERAHRHGMEFWGSLRANHPQRPALVDTADNSTFKIEHPEYCLATRPGSPFNWAIPEVRQERMALFEEAVTRYDIDGMELDLVFCPHLFEVGEADANRGIVTEFIAEARRIADAAASKRGRAVALGVRALPTAEGNASAGFDLATWMRDGLIDFVVPVVYGPRQMDVNFPFEWIVDLAAGSGCRVYPALQDRVYSVQTSGVTQSNRRVSELTANAELFRAGAAAYWDKGADGVYLPWFEWPIQARERQILSEIRDPILLREKRKRYWLPLRDVDGEYEGYASQLPLTLETGVDESRQVVEVYLADESARARFRLRMQLTGSVASDVMRVAVNGRLLDGDACTITRHGGGGDIYAWMDFPVPAGCFRAGRNTLGVGVLSRPRNLVANVVLQSVEVMVDHPGHAANTEQDRISMGRRL